MGTLNAFSIPGCVPLAAAAALIGIGCVAFGWWSMLPARLPGDDLFNAQRTAGLALRTVFGLPQPQDAPDTPGLVMGGISALIAGVVLLALGAAIRMLRATINDSTVRAAGDLRLVLIDGSSAAAIAGESTALTTVVLGNPPVMTRLAGSVGVRFDAGFLKDTLPRCAARTRELLALGENAEANITLARSLIELRKGLGDSQPLERLAVRIDPRELRTSVGRDGFAEFADAASDARLTSLPEAQCRRLLRDQTPNKVRLVHRDARAAIVIIGLGETGLELLARVCAQAQSPNCDPLTMILVDTQAPAVMRELLELWPTLALAAEFRSLALEPRLPQSATALFRHLLQEKFIPTCVYLALEDPALSAAWVREIELATRLHAQACPLVLCVGQESEDASWLLIEDERLERLQRQLHLDYVERYSGIIQTSPSAIQWSRLPFDLQEDNRSVADHLWSKACDLGARIVEGVDGLAIDPTDLRIEDLAAAEHRRWLASRAVAGWRYGSDKSDSERTHPSIVPWPQLSGTEREKDRDVIRKLSRALSAAELKLQPLFGVSVARIGVDEAGAEELAAVARDRAHTVPGAMPHLVLAVEDARSIRLARRLSEITDVAISLVIAQPLVGLAIAAGLPTSVAASLAEKAQTLWITEPERLDEVLAAWPALQGAQP